MNIETIAQDFEHRAWQATAFGDRLHKTQRAKMLAEREERTWRHAATCLRESAPVDTAALGTFTPDELREIAYAIQWDGHFANLGGDCRPGGPAFSTIRRATAALEARGHGICHSGAVRAILEQVPA